MSSVSKVWSTTDAEKLIVMMARVSAPKNVFLLQRIKRTQKVHHV
jgi:hypothetical protein